MAPEWGNIVRSSSTIEIRLLERPDTQAQVTCDGVTIGELAPGDRLIVTPAEEHVTLLHPAAKALGAMLEQGVLRPEHLERAREQLAAFEPGARYARAQMLRIPFAPLYTRYEEVWNAAAAIREMLLALEA